MATSLGLSDGLAAVLTTFGAPELTVHVTATRHDTGLVLQDSIRLSVNFPPKGPATALPFSVRPSSDPIVAHATTIALSAPAAEWAPSRRAGAPLEYLYALRLPDGALLALPGHEGFGPAPNVTVLAPWPPGPPRAAQRYAFALFVRDAFGATTGPVAGPDPLTVRAPACPPRAPCRGGPGPFLPHFWCLSCGGHPVEWGVVEDRLRQPAPDLRGAQWLLRHVAFLARQRPPAAPLHRTASLAAHVLNATAPYLSSPALGHLLLQTLDAVFYAAAAPALSLAADAVAGGVVAGAVAAIREATAPQCPPRACDLQAPQMRVTRAAFMGLSDLPAEIAAGPGRFHLPPAFAAALAAQNCGYRREGLVEVVTTARGPASGLLVPPVGLELWDAASGAALDVQGLPEPVAVSWAVDGAAVRRPVEDWYRCVYATPGGWSPAGTWLAPSAGLSGPTAVTCLTSHLSTFAIQRLPRVTGVSGCGHAEGPAALYCRPVPPALTIAGAHFGPAGAAVTLRAIGAEWRCPGVRHVVGQEDVLLTCGPAAAGGLLPPDFAGQWASVEVMTAHGMSHVLPRAVLLAAPPTLSAIAPLPGGGCARRPRGALTDCPAVGAAFALYGQFRDAFTVVAIGLHECADVRLHNRSYLECRVAAGAGGPHPVRVALGLGEDRVVSAPAPFTVAFARPCAAKRGFWTGPGCGACEAAYYGPACESLCPGAPEVCGGHGTCDAGVSGSGACACYADPDRGYWIGRACDRCAEGYVGPRCTLPCPASDPRGSGAGVVCGGRGACRAAATDGGAYCACAAPFAGVACDLWCPTDAALGPCGGHGDCVWDAGAAPGRGRCVCHGDALRGHWTGEACDGCNEGWAGPGCTHPCPWTGTGPCTGHGRCAWEATSAVAQCVCHDGYVGAACAALCPRGGGGRVCSGHGACTLDANSSAARCVCSADAIAGHWDGHQCDACARGFAGVGCTIRCPRDSLGRVCGGMACADDGTCLCRNGTCGPVCQRSGADCAAAACDSGSYGPACAEVCMCGAHGSCLDGRYGSGACRCDVGWAGATCAVPCGGSAGGLSCGAYGRCDPLTGACTCLPGWRSPPGVRPCSVPCPGPTAQPCHGHGTCNAAAQCECDPDYGGTDCAVPCPRDEAGVPCGGHGVCESAGRCACAAGPVPGHWSGAACTVCAQGYYGAQCRGSCVSGTTVGRRCLCASGWAGAGCDAECPGGAAQPCGGHGACDALTGRCACTAGFAGPGCDRRCPVDEAGAVCSGHGVCNATAGVCECQGSPAGHWAGAACDRCRAGYLGPACALVCPMDNATGQVCGGHGVCTATGRCRCDTTPTAGYWTGPVCLTCARHRYGPDCRGTCPGGVCSPCGGHGVCSEGRAGDGTCACAQGPAVGYWAPALGCTDCQSGYYGLECVGECPGGAARPCGGHGLCSDGLHGSGACACEASQAHGFWAGATCGACARGYYGPACDTECPGGAQRPCSGHGACDGGVRGGGRCVCDVGYLGASCWVACPRAAGRVCGGHGACVGSATGTTAHCDCSAAPQGHWAGDACTVCSEGWVGTRCDTPCPVGGARAVVCAGAGACRAAAGSAEAVCDCYRGYYGSACAGECPGGSLFPCSGHGTCDPFNGTCACAAGPDMGYFAGSACDRCAEGWSGPACQDRCPLGAGARPCSGHLCQRGACYCNSSAVCGTACEEAGPVCLGLACDRGRYGPGCALQCPRGAAGRVCSGRGVCLQTVYSDGSCTCDRGYGGVDCGLACPGGAAQPCAGHGRCSPADGTCDCTPGFAGVACARVCPVRLGAVCAGHGVCNDTSAGNGACVCAAGYAAADCGSLCPGFAPERAPDGACGGHGECVSATAECICWQSAEAGHWTGAACGTCLPGWFGEECREECVHGDTAGRTCVCHAGYATANCSVACPGPNGSCTGHGRCRDTHTGDGTCACDRNWYSVDCSVHCDPFECFPGVAGPIRPRAQCNAVTGECECQRNASGHWDGPQCDHCVEGYWGLTCRQACDCNYHGSCGWLDGVCDCYRDEARGFWAGDHCDVCVEGYLEPVCKAKNVAISRPRELPAVAEAQRAAPGGAVVADAAHRLLYTGGAPLLVYDSDTDEWRAERDLGGVVRSGLVGPRHVVLVVERPGAQELTLAVLGRGLPLETVATAPLRLAPPPALAQRHRRRALRALEAPGAASGEPFVGAHALDGNVSVAVVFAGGEAWVTVLSADGAPLDQRRFAAARLQLREVRGAAVGRFADGRALFLAGASARAWQVTALPLPFPSDPVPLHDRLAPGVRGCAAPTPCHAAGGIAVGGGVAYVALEQAADLTLARVDLRGLRVERSARVEGVGRGARVTAVAMDPVLRAVFLAAHLPQRPSTVYKVHTGTLVPYGVTRMRSRGGHREVVTHLEPDVPVRRLYALTHVGPQPMVVTLLLYAVTAIAPPLADVGGGTLLRVAGEGLLDLGATECLFAGGLRTPATAVSATEVRCHTPLGNASAEGCSGEALELQLLPGLPTSNRIPLRRVNTPSIVGLSPGRGYYRTPQWVRVEGYGFVDSPYLSCLFVAEAGPSRAVTGPGVVRYVSSTEVQCRQPRFAGAFPTNSYLEVSVDGQQFSRSLKSYDIVGPPVRAVASNQTLTARAAENATVPELVLYTVDEFGHAVLDFDDGHYLFTAEAKVSGRDIVWDIRSGAVAVASEGVAVFDRLQLSKPQKGQYDLFVRSSLGALLPPVKITVLEGAPVVLAVVRQPSSETLNTETLQDQPVVELRDSAENAVVNPEPSGLKVAAYLLPGGLQSEVAVFGDGVFEFSRILVVAGYGIDYRLLFALAPVKGLHVANATSRRIRANPCPTAQFYVKGRTTCSDCPAGAVCDGTDVLVTQANYWRTQGSLVFVPCSKEPGTHGPRCMANRTVGTCSTGFAGPLCELCEAGRSGASCLPCGSPVLNWLIVGGISVGYCLLIGVVTYKAFRQDRHNKSPLALMLKIAVTYLQTFGILAPVFPSSVGRYVQSAGNAVSVQLPTAIVSCVLPGVDTYDVYYFNMLLPAAGLLVTAFVFRYDGTLGCLPTEISAQMHPLQQEKARTRSFTKGRSLFQILLVSLSVVLYFLYPTLIQQSAQLNECSEKDFGCFQPPEGRSAGERPHNKTGPLCSRSDFTGHPAATDLYGTQSFLAKDFSVRCSSAGYLRVRGASWAFLVAYGVGIPVAFNIVGRFLHKAHASVELNTFAFLMAGFRAEYRYWETLNLVRKGLIVSAVTFIRDPRLRIYVCMWLVMLFLALQYILQPFESGAANALEAASLLVLAVCLNLSLLWLHPYLDPGHPESYVGALDAGLMVFMGVLQVLLAACFLLAIFTSLRRAIVKRVETWLGRRKRRKELMHRQAVVLRMWRRKIRADPASPSFRVQAAVGDEEAAPPFDDPDELRRAGTGHRSIARINRKFHRYEPPPQSSAPSSGRTGDSTDLPPPAVPPDLAVHSPTGKTVSFYAKFSAAEAPRWPVLSDGLTPPDAPAERPQDPLPGSLPPPAAAPDDAPAPEMAHATAPQSRLDGSLQPPSAPRRGSTDSSASDTSVVLGPARADSVHLGTAQSFRVLGCMGDAPAEGPLSRTRSDESVVLGEAEGPEATLPPPAVIGLTRVQGTPAMAPSATTAMPAPGAAPPPGTTAARTPGAGTVVAPGPHAVPDVAPLTSHAASLRPPGPTLLRTPAGAARPAVGDGSRRPRTATPLPLRRPSSAATTATWGPGRADAVGAFLRGPNPFLPWTSSLDPGPAPHARAQTPDAGARRWGAAPRGPSPVAPPSGPDPPAGPSVAPGPGPAGPAPWDRDVVGWGWPLAPAAAPQRPAERRLRRSLFSAEEGHI